MLITRQWHVTRSYDDYQRIPEFLRPVEVQRRIPHRICAGLIVWQVVPILCFLVIDFLRVLRPFQVGLFISTDLYF